MIDDLLEDYWLTHYVNDDLDLCSLCGNGGVIDTTLTAVSPTGARAGRLNYCLCPNGQRLREARHGAPPVAPRPA